MAIHLDRSVATPADSGAFVAPTAAELGTRLVGETTQIAKADLLAKSRTEAAVRTDPASLMVPALFYGRGHEARLAANTRSNDDYAPSSQYRGGRDLSTEAQQHAGERLWSQSKYAKSTENGLYGCAASMSLVLEKAGYKYADSPTVGGLVSQLERHGWTKVSAIQAQPNDVMVAYNKNTSWQNGGGNSHLGIVGSDGNIWNNSKRVKETWQSEPADVAFAAYDSRFVLRPPQK